MGEKYEQDNIFGQPIIIEKSNGLEKFGIQVIEHEMIDKFPTSYVFLLEPKRITPDLILAGIRAF